MKVKYFTFVILILVAVSFFGCAKKTKQDNNLKPYLDQYNKLDQEDLKSDFLYGSDFETVSGLTAKGKKKEVLYFPSNVKEIAKNSISSENLKKVVFTSNIKEINPFSIKLS